VRKPPPQLLGFLRRHDPVIQSVVLRLRDVVIAEMAPCHEYIFQMKSKVVLLYGPTEKAVDDQVCSISAFEKHVDLSFRRGDQLPDPKGALEGKGKGFRQMRLKTLTDVQRPEIRPLIQQARKLEEANGWGPPVTGGEIATRVKEKKA
jgi:hypothetical protein